MQTKMHNTHPYILNPSHPITVNLIGCGGSGSQMLQYLGRIHHALIGLNHPGLDVTAWDPDRVTPANMGRQLFSTTDLGGTKSYALVQRINRFFSLTWKSRATDYPWENIDRYSQPVANITISCVDNYVTRHRLQKYLCNTSSHQNNGIYWLDLGNEAHYGQAVLGCIGKHEGSDRLSTIIELYGDQMKDSVSTEPSCSLAEALHRQDLMICPTVATLAAQMLWNLFRTPRTNINGFFVNLHNYNLASIHIK